jgi:nicotinamide riboside kinase
LKIVFTGGPSAGKTAMVALISKQFADDVAVVPEAASILFQGGFPRKPTPANLKHQQRAIYFLQLELEALVEEDNPGKILVCDRGTVDGAAYSQESPAEFFKSLGTTLDAELKRYDFVIHLGSPNGHYYDRGNPARIEKPSQARVLDEKTKEIWAPHSNRLVIHCHKDFGAKVIEALEFVSKIISKTKL